MRSEQLTHNKWWWPRVIASALVGFFGLCAGQAKAEFAICNQSFDVVNVAIGLYETDAFVTSGWWTIGPNQCANAIRDRLTARYVYVYAQDVFGKSILNGSTPMCVDTKKFVIRGETDCLIRGYLSASFVEVDTQRTERWTLFITPQP